LVWRAHFIQAPEIERPYYGSVSDRARNLYSIGMRMRWAAALLGMLPVLCAATPKPADWVPARWPWTDERSLELLSGTPINCLLLRHANAAFTAAAAARGIVTLAVVTPGEDARAALSAKPDGVVFEGDFPGDPPALSVPTIELAPRYKMKLGSGAAVSVSGVANEIACAATQ